MSILITGGQVHPGEDVRVELPEGEHVKIAKVQVP